MLRSEVVSAAFQMTLWELPATPTSVSQDASVVISRDEFLRVAAIDGRTPEPEAPRILGCDLGIHAAHIVRQALHGVGAIEDGLKRANDFLRAEQDEGRSAFPEASCIAADIDDQRATVIRAGDCDAWLLEGGRWHRIFGEGALTGEAAQRDRSWYEGSADLDLATLLHSERKRDYVNVESAWRTYAIGRFPETKLERTEVTRWRTLVLATDGARLTPERIERLEEWLSGLREWENTRGPQDGVYQWKPHDDVTVISIERRLTAVAG